MRHRRRKSRKSNWDTQFIKKGGRLIDKSKKAEGFGNIYSGKRTEWGARPMSKDQIESCGRNALRTISKLLEQDPRLRAEIKEYAKLHPYRRKKKEASILVMDQNKGVPRSYIS